MYNIIPFNRMRRIHSMQIHHNQSDPSLTEDIVQVRFDSYKEAS